MHRRPGGGPRARRPALPGTVALRRRARSGRSRAAAPPEERGGSGPPWPRPRPGGAGTAGRRTRRDLHAELRLVLPRRGPGRRRHPGQGHQGRRPWVDGLPHAGHRHGQPARPPPAVRTLPERAPRLAARHRHRRGVRPAPGVLRRDLRTVREGAGGGHRHARDLPRPPGPARHRPRPRHRARGRRPDRQELPAPAGLRHHRRARRAARAAAAGRRGTPVRAAVGAGRGPRLPGPRHGHAPLRRGHQRRDPAGPAAGAAHPAGRLPHGHGGQGGDRGAGQHQTRRPGRAHAVRHGSCRRGDRTDDRQPHRPGRPEAGAARRRLRLQAHPGEPDPRPVPAGVARSAGPAVPAAAAQSAGRHRRHQPLPARSGRGWHARAVHRRPARRHAVVRPPGPGAGARRHLRGDHLARADHRDAVGDDRLRPCDGRDRPAGAR